MTIGQYFVNHIAVVNLDLETSRTISPSSQKYVS